MNFVVLNHHYQFKIKKLRLFPSENGENDTPQDIWWDPVWNFGRMWGPEKMTRLPDDALDIDVILDALQEVIALWLGE